MMGPKPGPTGARKTTPRPTNPNKTLPYSLDKPGQGPGESDVPAEARRIVRNVTNRVPLPRARK